MVQSRYNLFSAAMLNDLVYVIKRSYVSTSEDDTQIFVSNEDPLLVQGTIISDFSHVDRWFLENGLKRNHSKYQAMVLRNGKANLEFFCENTIIPNSDKLEMLGVIVDDMLKFDIHVSNICRKVSEEVAYKNLVLSTELIL